MSGKGAKGLIMGKTSAAAANKDKDKDKKKPISRSSRAGLQVIIVFFFFLVENEASFCWFFKFYSFNLGLAEIHLFLLSA